MRKLNGFIFIVFAFLLLFAGSYAFANNIKNDFTAVESGNELSNIEKLYRDKGLKQFGYDIFNKYPSFAKDIKTGNDYIIKSGDKINVYLWGDSVDLISIAGSKFLKSVNSLEVDNDGHVFINGVGLVKVEGKSLGKAEAEIKNTLGKKFDSVRVKVTVQNPGSYPVMVLGNVANPGTVFIDANSSILDTLILAGGVLKEGSLRNITVVSKDKKIKVDLYDLLILGKSPNHILRENDVIFVSPIGRIIAIGEGAKRPGIYEFKYKEPAEKIINFAGGLLPSTSKKNVLLESFDEKTKQKTIEQVLFSKLSSLLPKDGDYIGFYPIYEKPENFVELTGNVKHPAVFKYEKGMKLSDILTSKEELLEKTYTKQAVIYRFTGLEKDIQTIAVSLKDFFSGKINPELKPMDKIEILKSSYMENIEVSGCIKNPGLVPFKEGLNLKDIVRFVEFTEERTSSNEHLISDKNTASERFNINAVVAEIIRLEDENPETSSVKQRQASEKENLRQPEDPLEVVQVVYLYDLLIKDTNNIELKSDDKIFFRKLTDKETARQIEIIGHVNMPGIYKIKPGIKLVEALKLAGGISDEGYLKGVRLYRKSIAAQQQYIQNKVIAKYKENMFKETFWDKLPDLNKNNVAEKELLINNQEKLAEIVKENSENKYGRISLNIRTERLDDISYFENVELEAGDKIYVPIRPRHIIVSGEVLNPATVSYHPRKTYKRYIQDAGGFTKYADKKRIYIVKANGFSYNPKKNDNYKIEAGDAIIVSGKFHKPVNWLTTIAKISQIAANSFMSVFVLTKL